MFLRISRNRRGRNVYEYAQIAERYRENGKKKYKYQRSISNPLSNQIISH